MVVWAGAVVAQVQRLSIDLVQKRVITLTYTRNVHWNDGACLLLFLLHLTDTCSILPDGLTGSIMMTRAELDRAFNNTAMKKRCVTPTFIFSP